MSIVEVRQQIVDDFIVHLNGLVHRDGVSPHRGMFESLNELQTLANRSPSALVAIRWVENVQQENNQFVGNAVFTVNVIANSRRNSNASTTAALVAQSIAQYISTDAKKWDFSIESPDQIRFVDVTTLKIHQSGVALWEVSWKQKIEFNDVDLSVTDIFEGYDADHFSESDDVASDDPIAQSTQTYPE
jgi:hypothetical protein